MVEMCQDTFVSLLSILVFTRGLWLLGDIMYTCGILCKCRTCSGKFSFAKCLCLGCLKDVTLGNTRILVYLAPRSYSVLGNTRMLVYLSPRSYSVVGNTRMLDKLTKVSCTFQLLIHSNSSPFQ